MSTERIPGVPVWLKVVRVSVANPGEYVIGALGDIREMKTGSATIFPIVAPDNAYGAMDLNTLPIPEGHERDGADPSEWFQWVDPSFPGEKMWLGAGGKVHSNAICGVSDCGETLWKDEDTRRILLRKKKQFRKVLVLDFEAYCKGFPVVDVATAEEFAANMNKVHAGTATVETREVQQ